jgi:hypothetical protein
VWPDRLCLLCCLTKGAFFEVSRKGRQ